MSDDSSSGENLVDMVSESEIIESSENEGQTWCICEKGGSAYGDMVECCNNSSIKSFHLHCISLITALKGTWYCSSQCEKSGDRRQCRCGSTSHLRTTSRDCPLDKKSKIVDEAVYDSENPIHLSEIAGTKFLKAVVMNQNCGAYMYCTHSSRNFPSVNFFPSL